MTVRLERLRERFRPQRLGRHVEHDARSRGFPAPAAGDIRSVRHRHYGAALDQRNVGACTGFALAQALNTAGVHRTGARLLHAGAGRERVLRAELLGTVLGPRRPLLSITFADFGRLLSEDGDVTVPRGLRSSR